MTGLGIMLRNAAAAPEKPDEAVSSLRRAMQSRRDASLAAEPGMPFVSS